MRKKEVYENQFTVEATNDTKGTTMSVRNKLIFLRLFQVFFSSDFLTFGRVGHYTCPHARPSGGEFPWRYYVASRSVTVVCGLSNRPGQV